MNIDDFLKQFVDGYLLGDLQSMAAVVVPSGKIYGGVGYPMVATTLAGMELLGELLMPNTDPFDPNQSNVYFLNYWDNYFVQCNPAYTGLGRIFRQLMRNGISHTFVAKPGIFVEKGTNRQMSIDTKRQEIYIDCNVFFREFEDSYLRFVRPIIEGIATSPLTTKTNVQTRLDSLETVYTNDSTGLFSTLSTLHASTNNTGHRSQVPVSPLFTSLGVLASGASGSMQPTTASTSSSISVGNSPVIPASVTVPYSTTTSGTLPPKTKL